MCGGSSSGWWWWCVAAVVVGGGWMGVESKIKISYLPPHKVL